MRHTYENSPEWPKIQYQKYVEESANADEQLTIKIKLTIERFVHRQNTEGTDSS